MSNNMYASESDDEEEDLGLEEYIEYLYDSRIEKKIKGSQMIRKLCENKKNLEILMYHQSLMGLLSRMLRDETKLNVNLMMNVLYIFYVFSSQPEFHEMLLQYKIDSIVVERIEYENNRYSLLIKEKTLDEKSLRKQEKLLVLCLHILSCLYKKIVLDKKLIQSFCNIVVRKPSGSNQSRELIQTTVSFLNKLLMIKDLKVIVEECGLFEKFYTILKKRKKNVYPAIVDGLFAFSFDKKYHDRFIDLIPSLVRLTKFKDISVHCYKILYRFSKERDGLEKLKSCGAIDTLLTEILQKLSQKPPKNPKISIELLAIGINISYSLGKYLFLYLENLVTLFIRTHNYLLGKIIRNIIKEQDQKTLDVIKGQVAKLCILATDKKYNLSVEELCETVGLIGSLCNHEKLTFKRIVEKLRMEKFFIRWLSSKDMMLQFESAIAIGTVCRDKATASIIGKTKIPALVCNIFYEHQDDDEFVLQCLYTIYNFLLFNETRQGILGANSQNNGVFDCMVQMYSHENEEIRVIVRNVLEIISESNKNVKQMILRKRFRMHNAEWCASVNNEEKLMRNSRDSDQLQDSIHSFNSSIGPRESDEEDDEESDEDDDGHWDDRYMM